MSCSCNSNGNNSCACNPNGNNSCNTCTIVASVATGTSLPLTGPTGGVPFLPAVGAVTMAYDDRLYYDPTADATAMTTDPQGVMPKSQTAPDGVLVVPNLYVAGMIDPIGVNFTPVPADPSPVAGTVWVDSNTGNLMLDNTVVGGNMSGTNCTGINFCSDIAQGAVAYNVNSTTTNLGGSNSTTVIQGTPIQVGNYFGCPVYRAYFYGGISNGTLTGSGMASITTLGPLTPAATCIVDWGGSWVGGDGRTYMVGANSLTSYLVTGKVVFSELYIDGSGLELATFDGLQQLTGTFIGTPVLPLYLANQRTNAPYYVWVDYTTCPLSSMTPTC